MAWVALLDYAMPYLRVAGRVVGGRAPDAVGGKPLGYRVR
jgi:hypothetical protein